MGGVFMRKRILLLLICLLLTAGSFDAVAYPAAILTEEEAIITSFESTGADVLESMVSCWAKLNDKFLDIRQLEAEMNAVIDAIDIGEATISKDVETGDQLNKVVLHASSGNKSYSIALESVKQNTGGESYIIVDVSIDGSYKELKAVRESIAKALPVDEASMNFSSCIIGTYKGELEEKEAEKKAGIALKAINAKKVEGIENEELKSISAFSSRVGGYVMSEQSKVNVQLAIRYSSYDDRTYIWIGTPLIPMGY
jgi:hypothetical protein